MSEGQTESPGMEPMPAGQNKEPLDIRKEFSDLLDEMTLKELNAEVDRRLKDELRALDEEEVINLLRFRNPARFSRDMLERGETETTPLVRAKLAFLHQMAQADDVRDRVTQLMNNVRGQRIKAAVDISFKKPAQSKSVSESLAGPQALLDEYDFNEAGKHCTMAMVVHIRDDGHVGFISPLTPAAPPNTKESLLGFWSKSFKYEQPNQYFVFFMAGKWNVINSKGETIPISENELTPMWREAIKRNREMH
ncbi:hypothetical protein JW752_04020 [Candidatus Peregrinibacteria bacterium]|nr:hypothetical protein [Candidatus Peregrinibacteria bacterium]